MSGDFEKDLKRSRPATGPDDLRQKALARAEEEVLDPFAASLRGLRPAGAGSGFRERVLAAAARERAAARRERFVRFAAVAVVALCVSVNLWVEARPETGHTADSGAETFRAGLVASEMNRSWRLAAMIRGRPARDIDWFKLFQARRALAWSEPFFRG